MAVLNMYDINAKANEISNELLKTVDGEDTEDHSAVLFEEMRILAVANRTMFKL